MATLEKLTMAERRERLAASRLYFVCEAWPGGGPVEPLLRAAFAGGVQMVQFRDDSQEDDELLLATKTFRRIAHDQGGLFIYNDRLDLAELSLADGAHFGQRDSDAREARELFPDLLLGQSTHTRDQIDAACEGGHVDYIGVGPVWETPTKPGRPAVGLDLVSYAAENATIPFFAIGGIDVSNVDRVVDAGARRVAVVRAIRDAEDPEGAALRLRAAVERAWS